MSSYPGTLANKHNAKKPLESSPSLSTLVKDPLYKPLTIYLAEFETGLQAKQAIKDWFLFYNNTRPHATFNGQTPQQVYSEKIKLLTNLAA